MAAKKGAGVVLLLLFLLLAFAGGSAWFIHNVLDDGEPSASGATASSGSSDPLSSFSGKVSKAYDTVRQKVMGGPASGQNGGQQAGQGAPSGVSTGSPSKVEAVVLGPDGKELPASQQPVAGPGGAQAPGMQPPPAGAGPSGILPPGAITTGEGADPAMQDAVPLADNMLVVPGDEQTPPAAKNEDPVVRPAFIDNFAAFLARNYWPKGTHPAAVGSGITTISLRWANLRYGAELRGLDGNRSDPGSARSAILNYVLNPAIVDSLQNLYADPFVTALHHEADERTLDSDNGRPLTAEEKREMFALYAGYASRLSDALGRYARDGAMRGRVEAFAASEEAVQEANRAFMESSLLHENDLESRDKQKIAASRLRMDKDAAAYQRTIREREAKRAALLKAMGGSGVNDDTLLYAAFWAYRRGANSASGLTACAQALSNISAKLSAAGKKI